MSRAPSPARAALPAAAVVLGASHGWLLGPIAAPPRLVATALSLMVLAPLALGLDTGTLVRSLRSTRAAAGPIAVTAALGPLLALALGHLGLVTDPNLARALLLWSLLPVSPLVPFWVAPSNGGASRAFGAAALTWIGMALLLPLWAPLLASDLGAPARALVARELVVVLLVPLLLGGIARFLLLDGLGAERFARHVEPVRATVADAGSTVLLYTLAAHAPVAALASGSAPHGRALLAILLLQAVLVATGTLLHRRRRPLPGGGAIAWLAATRHSWIAAALLPHVVPPAAVELALSVPATAILVELVVGAVSLAVSTVGSPGERRGAIASPAERPSIVPQ